MCTHTHTQTHCITHSYLCAVRWKMHCHKTLESPRPPPCLLQICFPSCDVCAGVLLQHTQPYVCTRFLKTNGTALSEVWLMVRWRVVAGCCVICFSSPIKLSGVICLLCRYQVREINVSALLQQRLKHKKLICTLCLIACTWLHKSKQGVRVSRHKYIHAAHMTCIWLGSASQLGNVQPLTSRKKEQSWTRGRLFFFSFFL